MKARATASVLLTVLGGALAYTVTASGEPTPGGQVTVYVETTVTVRAPSRYQGHGPEWWANRAVHNRRQRDHAILRLRRANQRMRRQALDSRRRYAPTVALAVAYARAVYGIDQTARVRCESHGDVYARNNQGSDSPTSILQFKPSTWRTTPFAGFSIYDPVAQALAGGWMVRAGRSREWACPL